MDNLEEMHKFLQRDKNPKNDTGRNGKYEQTIHKYWNWN